MEIQKDSASLSDNYSRDIAASSRRMLVSFGRWGGELENLLQVGSVAAMALWLILGVRFLRLDVLDAP